MKRSLLYIMALFYMAAGINHFANAPVYAAIMPPWLPYHLPLIYLSGIFEFVFGALLIPQRTRPAAAWLIVLLLIAIFPANIQMTLNYVRQHNPSLWITLVRLPLQGVLIAWAWYYTRRPASGIGSD
ncbi:MAG: DoxX family protein [Puia sp.]|nr:DoxX family protein [Puia sp.]